MVGILKATPDLQRAAQAVRSDVDGVFCNIRALLTDLKSCSTKRDLQWGKKIHEKAVASRYESNLYVVAALVNMYGKCGSMQDSRRVFDSIGNPHVGCWNALLQGYANNGEGLTALDMFTTMKESGYHPDSVTYVAALKACTSLAVNGGPSGKRDCLERGRRIHSEIGYSSDHFVQNTLIVMYAKCGSMEDARSMFDSVENPQVVAWTALLNGYADNGQGHLALEMFLKMKEQGCIPDSVTYVAVIKACTSLAMSGDESTKKLCLKRGREIHAEVGIHLDRYVQNSLVDMYAKCRSMVDARRVFEGIQMPNDVSWNSLLLGYVENGEGQIALDLFSKMKLHRSNVTYVAALKACTSLAANEDARGKECLLQRGRDIHSDIGIHLQHNVRNTLIGMYAKCGSMLEARRVFDSITRPDVVSWTNLLLGYAESGEGQVTLELFSKMKASGINPDSRAFVAALKACTSLTANGDHSGCLERGREIHLEIGSHLNYYVQGTLIDMYAKCGSMMDARRVFQGMHKPDVVSWTSLLLGYAESGEGHITLDLFSLMKARGCTPDSVAYAAAFKACSSLAGNEGGNGKKYFLERGREIHMEIGFHINHYVQSTLIEMYAKCGSMNEAHRVFDTMEKPDLVSWTALLSGYAENGEPRLALDMFSTMKERGFVPDSVTYVAALKACGYVGDLAFGRKLLAEITDFNTPIVSCLVDFFAKCGSIEEARQVFDTHVRFRDVRTWTALLSGYASFGDTDSVFSLFEAMEDEGIRPDAVTFVCLLLCCSHAGLVEKAREYFDAMPVQYRVSHSLMHFNCMVDVLGRANRLNEAIAVIRKMPCNPDAVTWMTLLGACRKWKNVEIGRGALQALADMNKKNASACVLMAQIFASNEEVQERDGNQGNGHSAIIKRSTACLEYP